MKTLINFMVRGLMVPLFAVAIIGCTSSKQNKGRTQPSADTSAESLMPQKFTDTAAGSFTAEQKPTLVDGRSRVWIESAIEAVGEAPPQGRWGYADAAGKLVIPAVYKAASDFASGRALVLLNDDYIFIDTVGAIVAGLVDTSEIGKLPAPPSGCSSLESYMDALGGEREARLLIENPQQGEQALNLEVRKLEHGCIRVHERGWEGWSDVLVLPGRSVEQAREILNALLRSVRYEDVTGQGIIPDDAVTYQLTPTDGAGEFYGIRVLGKGVEIRHTIWAS